MVQFIFNPFTGNFDAITTGNTSPLTTKGDLWGYSTVDARVPVGTDGQVLTADSGQALGVSWQTAAASLSNSNYIVNGGIDLIQRLGPNTINISAATGESRTYGADRFSVYLNGSTAKSADLIGTSDQPGITASGFQNRGAVSFTNTASVTLSDMADVFVPYAYSMEGYDYAEIAQKTITISFWIKADITGVYTLALNSPNTANRNYTTTFTISTTATWEFKSITIILDTASGYVYENEEALRIVIGGMAGSSATTSTLNTWQAGTFYMASTADDWASTNGANITLHQVSLIVGSSQSATGFRRAGFNIAEELLMCQRYYEKSYKLGLAPGLANADDYADMSSQNPLFHPIYYKANKRSTSVAQVYSPVTGASGMIRDQGNGIDVAPTLLGSQGAPGYFFLQYNGTINAQFHWTADADYGTGFRLYTEDLVFDANIGAYFSANIRAVRVDSSDDILIGWEGGLRLTKLSPTGIVDTAFDTNLGAGFTGASDVVYSVSLDASDNIYTGGDYTSFDGNSAARFTKLSNAGIADTAFNTNLGTGFNIVVFGSVVDPSDGSIYVGGSFTSFNGNSRAKLVKLNSDGTENTTFATNIGTGFNNSVSKLGVDSMGRLIVIGTFVTFNGNTRNRIVRLNSDGTEDTAFYTALGTAFNNNVTALAITADDSIVLGGDFTDFNGTGLGRIGKLDSTGTLVTSFVTNVGGGADNAIVTMALNPDQQVAFGGVFTNFNSNARGRLDLISSDGVEYANFVTGTGSQVNNANVFSLDIDSQFNIIVGGSFTSFNGNSVSSIVKITSTFVI